MVLIVLHLLVSPALAFNFDTDFPIVYRDPQSSSYFGYSVILHSDLQPWIQIGMPKAKAPGKFKDPGRIYRCGIFGPCRYLDVVANAVSTTHPATVFDGRENAWLGGGMDIDERSGRFVMCSHRWLNDVIEDHWMLGACYWSDINSTKYEKAVPLSDMHSAIIKDQNVNVYNYGQGQAGFSTHFSNLKNGSELLLGAPGVYNWGGTALIYRDGSAFYPQPSRVISARHGRAAFFNDFSDVIIGNAGKTPETAAFGLFGYAVTSGYFFNKDKLLYVSGAPRSKLCRGQIFVFSFASLNNQPLLIKDSRQGEQLGEYFGAALAAGDINDDGLDDVIVGSPFYTTSKDNYNEGRIFVFLGNSKETLEAPQRNVIEGKELGGQFGSCIMFMGDLHMDGYSDVAVSAPYEDDGSGTVYIYRGNAGGLDSQPSQRIVGKSFVPTIRGFGISLSRPTDIDGNYYKDLAVGAYLSGHVVLLRSRPVVTLQQRLISTTPRLEHNTKNFDVKACFWYIGENVPSSINITRTVKVDELRQRAYLAAALPTIEEVGIKDSVCQNITVLLKDNLDDLQVPIVVEVTVDLVVKETVPQVLEVNSANSSTDRFCSSCPVENIEHSIKTEILKLPFSLGCENDNVCITQLDFESKFLNISGDKYVLGSSEYLTLETTIFNYGEKAYLTRLTVELPKSIYFRSTPAYCLETNSSSVITCDVENPLLEKKQKSLTLDLDLKEVNIDKYGDKLNFTFTVSTSSKNLKNNVFSSILHVTREADLGLSGKSSTHSYSYNVNATHEKPNFTQIYQINKFGVSPIEEVLLRIAIPTHIKGKNFLQVYLPEGNLAGQPIHCESQIDYIIEEDISEHGTTSIEDSIGDPMKVIEERQPVKRTVKRSTPNEQQKDSLNNEDVEYPSNRTFYINCSHSDVDCFYVNCLVGPFRTTKYTAVLRIKMLLDFPVITEMLGDKDIIIVSTDGLLRIKNPANFTQSGSEPDIARVSTLFIQEAPEKAIELWIYLVASVTGVLVLLLIIMGLQKAGFFQRKTKEELEALQAENENE